FLSAEPALIQCRKENQRKDCFNKQSSHDGEGHWSPEYRWRDRNHAVEIAVSMIGRKRVLLGTLIGWRPAFGILIAVSALVLLLSFRLKPDEGRPDVEIDLVGVVFAAAAIASSVSAATISTGGDWGSQRRAHLNRAGSCVLKRSLRPAKPV